MTDYKECNRCSANCRHKGAIRLCICGKFVKVAQTNGDRIRAMTDEELEMFILNAEVNAAKHALDTNWEGGFPITWLKQEAL